MRVIILAAMVAAVASPALASRGPAPEARISTDVAAIPAYQPESSISMTYRHHARHERHHHEAHREAPRHIKESPPPAPLPYHPPPMDAVLASATGALVGVVAGWADGVATALPAILTATPERLTGYIDVNGQKFRYGSGGHGWSIPSGQWPITPDAIGSIGTRLGAIGINDGTIYDRRLGRDREGIELHRPTNGKLLTAGCLAVEEWERFKKLVLAMIGTNGQAFLLVNSQGARVSPTREPVIDVVVADVQVGHPRIEHRRHYAERRHHRVRYASR